MHQVGAPSLQSSSTGGVDVPCTGGNCGMFPTDMLLPSNHTDAYEVGCVGLLWVWRELREAISGCKVSVTNAVGATRMERISAGNSASVLIEVWEKRGTYRAGGAPTSRHFAGLPGGVVLNQ